MKILINELLKYKPSLFFLLVSTYVATIFELTLPLLLANALNVGIIQNYGLNYIKYIAIMMLTLIIVVLILNIIINYIITRTSTLVSTNIKNLLFKKILYLKNDEFKKYPISTLITRTNQDCEQIKNFTSSFLSIIFKAPIMLISCITILKTLNNNFFIILFVSIFILIFFLAFIVIKLVPLTKNIQKHNDTLNKHLKEKIIGFKTIKSYNNLSYEDSKFIEENKKYLHTSNKILKISSSINPFLNLIVNTITIIILFLCINLVKTNALEAGTIIATIQYILQILLSIMMISLIIISFPTTKISINRINEVIKANGFEEKEEINDLEIENISFDNISFSYNNSKLLENISFTIKQGENIGIIGLNGSGKSTLIKLLFKEHTPNEGTIKINNTDINDISRKNITHNLTYVTQTPYLLKGTILENIAFANNNLTMNDIAKIIHTCNLENFINSKKENLNYKIEESGANLSGGQKQRISLARALAKNNNFIILDEPFSALDYKNEKQILDKLNTFYKEKTFIIISQRISSLMNCNKIIILDEGKIIDIGTHNQLLEKNKLYQDIYNSQKEVIEYDI